MKNVKMENGRYTLRQWRDAVDKAEMLLRSRLDGNLTFTVNWRTNEIVFRNREENRDWRWHRFHLHNAFAELIEAYYICGGK